MKECMMVDSVLSDMRVRECKLNSVIIAEEQMLTAYDLKKVLEELGYSVPALADKGSKVVELARVYRPSVVLMDVNIKGEIDGLTAAECIRNELKIPVVLTISYDNNPEIVEKIKNTGSYWLLCKPIDKNVLYGNIEMAFTKFHRELTEKNCGEQYRLLFESMDEGIALVKDNGIIFSANENFGKIINTSLNEIINKNISIIFNDTIGYEILLNIKENKFIPTQYDLQIAAPDKKCKWVRIRINAVLRKNGDIKFIFVVCSDITLQRENEKRLHASIQEKELLLKEIHHRVKNNLQVISSLLNLQSEYIQNVTDKEVFKESRNRVKSISLIHEKLYQSSDIETIDFADYLKGLTAHLFYSYCVNSNKIKLITRLESVLIRIDIATPCGLITNELISNSLKHAFSSIDTGEIRLEMSFRDNEITMCFSDNGRGISPDTDLMKVDSMGMQLVFTLVGQLNARLSYRSCQGCTTFILKIPYPKEKIL